VVILSLPRVSVWTVTPPIGMNPSSIAICTAIVRGFVPGLLIIMYSPDMPIPEGGTYSLFPPK